MKYKQIIARQKGAEARIVKHYGDPSQSSGVYVFHRYNHERQCDCYYIGQAKNLRRRIAQHLLEYDHIAVSLKKYGLFDSEKNPEGWTCEWKYSTVELLDEMEQAVISLRLTDENAELYNITSGGQGKGKVDINPRAERKGYHTGKLEGKQRAYTEIATLIEKYTTGITSKGGAVADRKTAELIEKLRSETV